MDGTITSLRTLRLAFATPVIALDNGSLGYAHPVERLAYDPYGRLLGSVHSAYASHQWWRDFNCDGTAAVLLASFRATNFSGPPNSEWVPHRPAL